MRMGFRILQLAVALQAVVAPLHAAPDKEKPAFSIKTPIERIAANPQARAVLERELPGFTTHPQYDQFKAMSLETLEAMFPDAVPHERVKAVDTALRAIPLPGPSTPDAMAATATPSPPSPDTPPPSPSQAPPPAPVPAAVPAPAPAASDRMAAGSR
ncbi:hypothetical protein RN629_14750 [Sphingomonadaceae bacterium jetA1]|uniref:hypothetical protein n=1 Tax=Facivitalis istanbulensis TaxID=3075838 RepID=UPI00347AA85B